MPFRISQLLDHFRLLAEIQLLGFAMLGFCELEMNTDQVSMAGMDQILDTGNSGSRLASPAICNIKFHQQHLADTESRCTGVKSCSCRSEIIELSKQRCAIPTTDSNLSFESYPLRLASPPAQYTLRSPKMMSLFLKVLPVRKKTQQIRFS